MTRRTKVLIGTGAVLGVIVVGAALTTPTEPDPTSTPPTPTATTTPDTKTPPLFDQAVMDTAVQACVDATDKAEKASRSLITAADIRNLYAVVADGYRECGTTMEAAASTVTNQRLWLAVTTIADTATEVADWAEPGWPGTVSDAEELMRRVSANTDAFVDGTRVLDELRDEGVL